MYEQIQYSELLNAVAEGREIRTDSRQVEKGDIFVALPGFNHNAAQFIPHALDKGAEYVVCKQNVENFPCTEKLQIYRCSDPNVALGQLARIRYGTGEFAYKLIGITGTNGKTTISYLLEHMLEQAGWKVGVMGTISYRCPGFEQEADLTTPGCLQTHALLSRMGKEKVDAICMEVSSHALDQGRVLGLNFDLAVFSNLSQDHLDYHKEMESYFRSKARLFGSVNGHKPVSVINLDDSYGARLAEENKAKWGYTLQGECRGVKNCLQGELLQNSRKGLKLYLYAQDREWGLSSSLIGGYNASNLLAVQATGWELGLDLQQLQNINAFSGVPGRLEWIPNSRGLHIFLDYAHTPDALQNLLSTLRELDFANIVVLFGCGGDRDKNKRPRMGRVVSKYADKIVLTSDNPRNENPGQIIAEILPGIEKEVEVLKIEDRRKAIATAISQLGKKDVLIIAGKGHENYQQVGEEKVQFNDAAVARELL